MTGLSDKPSGAELVRAIAEAARAEGVAATAWIRERGLSHEPYRWMKALSASKDPLARNVDRVKAALGGKRFALSVEPVSTKRKVNAPIPPEKIAAMKASSAVRLTRSRLAHAPDAKGKKGRELLIAGKVWTAIEAEAAARKISPEACFALALSAGIFTLEHDRFEEEQAKEG